MNQQLARTEVKKTNNGSLLLGTGLVVASMILVPTLTIRLNLKTNLTKTLRITLMKTSNRAINNQTNVSRAT